MKKETRKGKGREEKEEIVERKLMKHNTGKKFRNSQWSATFLQFTNFKHLVRLQ